MSEYVNRVTLEVNGQSISDFTAVTENEVEVAKQVNLMNKTGHMGVTPRYGVSVDYAVPVTGAINWAAVKDGRLTIEYEGGQRVTYTGVYTLKVGEGKTEEGSDKPLIKTISLGAEGRKEE